MARQIQTQDRWKVVMIGEGLPGSAVRPPAGPGKFPDGIKGAKPPNASRI